MKAMRSSRSIVIGYVFILILCFSILSPATYAQEKIGIKIAGARVEDPWYAFAQALAQFVNKKSNWLQAEVVTTAGLTANLEMIKAQPDVYIGLAPTSTTLHARQGHEWGDKRGNYDTARFISNITTMTQVIVTYDPEIKTMADLAGKTVDVGRKGAGNTPDHLAVLEAYGLKDKVKLSYSGFGGGAKRMMDGFCDATFIICSHTYPSTFMKGSLIDQMETKKPLHYIGFDREKLIELRQKEHGTIPVFIPANALDSKNQPEDLWGFNDAVYLMADVKMDPKIVEEVTRVIFETKPAEWQKWHPQGIHMTDEIKPASPVPMVVPPHDGARAYYKSNNIKMYDLADLLNKR